MSFIARVSRPCTKCGIMIEKGTSAGFTWDRVHGGFVHSACINGARPSMPNNGNSGKPIPLGPKTTEASLKAHQTLIQEEAREQMLKELGQEVAKQLQDLQDKSDKDNRAELLAKLIKSYSSPTEVISEAKIREIAKDEAKKTNAPVSLNIKLSDMPEIKLDMAHKLLPLLIKLCAAIDQKGHRPNLYLHGPAGSGKSTAARQASEALKLAYGYVSLNPQTPDSRLLGYMHAGGEYVPSEFFRRYTEGGLFCIDEIDNAAASLVTTLNGLLENGQGAFPHGVFNRHPDFVCVCTANTIGRGGDVNYPERRSLDGAFLERFIFIEWTYDTSLTRAIVGGILGDQADTFISWVDTEGNKLQARYPTLIISPRAYIQGAFLEKLNTKRKDIIDMVIARGLK
jgi:hypothetical protein